MKKLKIGFTEYTVDLAFKPIIGANGDELFGEHVINQDEAVIRVDSRMEPAFKVASMLHEIFHALDFRYGLGLSEGQIKGLANSLVETLGNNKKLVDFIVQGVKSGEKR